VVLRDLESNGERNRGLHVLKSAWHGAFESGARIRAVGYWDPAHRCLYRPERNAHRIGGRGAGSERAGGFGNEAVQLIRGCRMKALRMKVAILG
jgi:hypothetical protein